MSDQLPPPPPPLPPSDGNSPENEPTNDGSNTGAKAGVVEPSEAEKIRATYVDVYLGDEQKPLSKDNERILAMSVHLSGLLKYISFGVSIAGPIVVWVLFQGKSPYLKDEAEKAFKQQLIVIVLLYLLSCIGSLTLVILIGFFFLLLIPIVGIVDIYYTIRHTLDCKKRLD